jgi:hypothetical protein
LGTKLLFNFLRVIWAVPPRMFPLLLETRVLSGERELSKAHVRKPAEHFKLNPGYFL